jgi:CDP-paratose 2-epimerase
VKHALITGGAGFIGTNLADRLIRSGVRVRIFDNLSRPGAPANLEWLRNTHRGAFDFQRGDVRVAGELDRALSDVDHVFHFAAQVAVTSSVEDPLHDFEVNAGGTVTLLEAIRRRATPPSLIFTSTNKVYGALDDMHFERHGARYFAPEPHGVNETRPLDFHSPYGCSKGAADQYVRDYARIYGLRTVVFRMSCIYGPHQFGTEDQGWVAHFLITALDQSPLTIYGDGAQVRDILFVEDLVEAFIAAERRIDSIAGRAFNIGGGPENCISLLDLMDDIENLNRRSLSVRFGDWRPGDQKYYVSDFRAFQKATGWRPRVGVHEGVRRLHEWLMQARAERAASGHLVHA